MASWMDRDQKREGEEKKDKERQTERERERGGGTQRECFGSSDGGYLSPPKSNTQRQRGWVGKYLLAQGKNDGQ